MAVKAPLVKRLTIFMFTPAVMPGCTILSFESPCKIPLGVVEGVSGFFLRGDDAVICVGIF